MKKLVFALLLFAHVSYAQTLSVIPQPAEWKMTKGAFALTSKTKLVVKDNGDKKAADFFNDYIQKIYGLKLETTGQDGINTIRLNTRKFITAPSKDAYRLMVNGKGVTIEGDTYAGTFYGIQTLIQLLPTSNNATAVVKGKPTLLELPFLSVSDYPRFHYRGMHLDVGRHFFSPSFVKKYIDYLALHKINYFHWHLTEDQGWRIEIKKYPLLTSIGAWRNGTIVGRYPGTSNDNIRYGGYYTQEEVKEIVKYASDRYITVIPEIEMPGHSSAAIAAYPWLSCFPEKETVFPTASSEKSLQQHGKKVQETWGVFDDVYCAGKDSTFLFLQQVMDEILPLFPSKYIHIGGDECPKGNWKNCPSCQARIKALGLKDEHELQSYFIQRMEKYINTKGKNIFGWDEILEGGLAPNALVMSWRGEKGGIEAAKQKHHVVMCPEEFTYLNWSQTRYEDSVTFGRFTPIEKVYNYEPVPKELSTDEAKYIMGVQANAWSEYMKYPTTVEYNVFPRMSAIAEIGWTQKDKKNWSDFEQRLPAQFKRYDLWKARYSNAYFAITPALSPSPTGNGVVWSLESKAKGADIMYALGSEKAVRYQQPVPISKTTTATVQLIDAGKEVDNLVQPFYINKATGKKTTLAKTPMGGYQGQGSFSLVNGVYSAKNLSFPDWLGWAGSDMETTIDLGKTESLTSVKMHTLDQTPSSIYLPQYMEVLLSNDGINFSSAGASSKFVSDVSRTGFITVNFENRTARFVKVVAKNFGVIPSGSPGAGSRSLLFCDEVQVE